MTIAFKAKFCGGDADADSAKLGPKYYEDFMKRNKYLLRNKRGEKFAKDRAEWSTYTNFKHMYDHTYEELVASGNAIKLDEPGWFDEAGDQVATEAEAYGLQSQYIMSHPENVFYLNECGNNTNMKKDGHNGGGNYICVNGTTPKQISSTTDAHFTTLGVTAVTE